MGLRKMQKPTNHGELVVFNSNRVPIVAKRRIRCPLVIFQDEYRARTFAYKNDARWQWIRCKKSSKPRRLRKARVFGADKGCSALETPVSHPLAPRCSAMESQGQVVGWLPYRHEVLISRISVTDRTEINFLRCRGDVKDYPRTLN